MESNTWNIFANVPCVLINEQTDRPNWTSIIVDNYNGMYELVEHLVRDHGYHNFAFGRTAGNTDACQRKKSIFRCYEKNMICQWMKATLKQAIFQSVYRHR